MLIDCVLVVVASMRVLLVAFAVHAEISRMDNHCGKLALEYVLFLCPAFCELFGR